MIRLFGITLIVVLAFSASKSLMAQTVTGANTITTAVPFLGISPDSRAAGMGDVGVGTTADVNSQHWNPAKYVYMESEFSVGLSYSPWLRNLVDDISLSYLSGYKKIDDVQAISASLRYFSLGDILFTDDQGTSTGQQSPNEFSIDVAYSRLLSDVFSGAVALRFIRSDLTGGQLVNGVATQAGTSFAADVAFYYFQELNRSNSVAAGINIQNIGAKISYTDGEVKDFIPTSLKLGASYNMEMDDYNSLSFALEANKLLVPTPSDTSYNDGAVISGGIGSDIGVIEGIFKSFGDAPGGFQEELQEITWSIGLEYWYNQQFALRAGYFYEHENKGNRKYFTAGAGLKMNVFALDFAYLFPTQRNHPLENTLRFSLTFDIDSFGRQR